MSLTPTDYIWMDGEFVPWDEANVHVLTHTLHYGLGVFEGIRSYETDDGPAVFRLRAHMDRFENSADLVDIDLPYSVDELFDAVKETIRKNDMKDCYIRPIAYYGYGKMGLNPEGAPVEVAIAVWPWGSYLGEEGLEKGVRATVTQWRRIHSKILQPQAKTVANYANSILAKRDALERGYDEAILKNMEGNIAEGPGENLFVVADEEIITPPLSSGVLAGITRDSVIKMAENMGYSVKEENIDEEQLLNADEAFFTGTAAEVTPISEIDGTEIGDGCRGEVTEKIQSTFFDVVRGKESGYENWLDYV